MSLDPPNVPTMDDLSATPREQPFIWVTWLASVLAGPKCGWAPWFRTNHELRVTQPDDPDAPMWRARHEEIVDRVDSGLVATGLTTERELPLKVTFEDGVSIFGKADLVATDVDSRSIVIYEAKGGKWPQPSDQIQLLIYMWLMEATVEESEAWDISGWLVRQQDNDPFESLPEGFDDSIMLGIEYLTSPNPPARVPGSHCRFCSITRVDCPVRQD